MVTNSVPLSIHGKHAIVDGNRAPLDFTPIERLSPFKVLFVYPNYAALSVKHIYKILLPHLGLAVLSGCAKRIGAGTALCDLTVVPSELSQGVFLSKVQKFEPDLVAITAMSNQWPTAAQIIRLCQRQGLAHLVGGSHASAHPEEVIEVADALVVGEGEGAFMDVIRSLSAGEPLTGIANTWVRHSGEVVPTERRRLIENLDDLPFPDWRLFQTANYRIVVSPNSYLQLENGKRELVRASIEGSRGCPYKCTYCSNSSAMESYRGKGVWRREKSPRRIIDELKAFRQTLGGLDYVEWVDEIFMTGKARLAEFCDLYRRELGVPFEIMDRPENVTEPKIKMMADAGLHWLAMGFESGDEHIQKEVLNRKTQSKVIHRAFTLPQRYGIKTYAFAILGLPGQDEASMLKTWRALRRLRPDGAQFSFFHPKRGTVLFDECVQNGMYDPAKDIEPYRYEPVIKHDSTDDQTIIRYHKLLSKYSTAKGFWPVFAFHLGRRSDWLCDGILRCEKRWKENRAAGLSVSRNLYSNVESELRALRANRGNLSTRNTYVGLESVN